MKKVTYPKVGTRKQAVGRELFVLAPLPLATGYLPMPQQINLKKATATTLDHGKGDFWSFEFGSRLCLTMVAVIFLAMFITHVLGAYLLISRYDSFLISFFEAIPKMLPMYLYCVGGTFLFMLCVSIGAFRQATKRVPLRFNREKRQVYAVVGKEHFIANWEAINVQIETSLLVSPQSAVRYTSLVFQIPDASTDRQATMAASYPAEALAIADWEAIRVFMEQGLDALKQQSQTPPEMDNATLKELEANPEPTADYYEKLMNQYQEGSVKYFYAVKNYTKYTKGKFGYGLWNIGHIATAWTLPCYLAQWLTKKNFVTRPPELNKWSKPIPQEQWAKPSEALLAQNKALQASYGVDGIHTIQDYFTQHPVK